MKSVQILLTGQARIGWNYVVLNDGRPLAAEDPEDFDTAALALRAALAHLQAHTSNPNGDEHEHPGR